MIGMINSDVTITNTNYHHLFSDLGVRGVQLLSALVKLFPNSINSFQFPLHPVALHPISIPMRVCTGQPYILVSSLTLLILTCLF